MARGIDTKCIHLEEDEGQCSHYGALSYPIYQTATYAHPGVGQSTGFDYSRLQNPTREHLEKMVAALENGIDAFALSSGMAAISLRAVPPGRPHHCGFRFVRRKHSSVPPCEREKRRRIFRHRLLL